MSGLDHGELNLPLQSRYGRGGIDAAIVRHLEQQRREEDAKYKALRKGAREREAARIRLTREDVMDARMVRDEFAWHRVVRVNARTVTVKTDYSWNTLIQIAEIRQVAR